MNPEGDTTAVAEPTDSQVAAPEVPDTGTSESSAPLSMAEAMAEAQAVLESNNPPDANADASAGEGENSGAAATETQSQPDRDRKRTLTEQGVLQRITDLVAQGREAELDPHAQGILRKMREDFGKQAIDRKAVEDAEEAEFRDMFLGLEAERVSDPETFAQKLLDQPDYARFYRMYQAAHPDISADNPNPQPKPKSEHEIRRELANAYGQGFEMTLDAIGREAGIPQEKFDALKAEFRFGAHPDSNNLASFMAKVVTEVATALTEPILAKERERIAREERAAAELAANRRFAIDPSRHIPRGLAGRSPDPSAGKVPAGPIDMRTAHQLAKEVIANAS